MGALTDRNDPIRHDVEEDKAVLGIIARSKAWLARNPDRAHLFCQHGSYVGFNRALAYYCPLCPET